MISQVTATTFHRFLGNGRTSPAVFTCEGSNLSAPDQFVVKLRGGLERRERGLSHELYASLLATYFGIQCPRPAVVLIERDLAEAIIEELPGDPHRAQIIRDSIGLNFGSQFLVNLTVWPVDKYVPITMQEAAIKVYAFDAMIQNPDRSFNNPNLGSRGDDLFIFDHESAFSFLLAIFPSQTPWRLITEGYLDRHVFARALRQVTFPADFLQLLSGLSNDLLHVLSEQIPDGWRSEDLPRIGSHLALIREHAAEFAEEVTGRLA
ncbi:MAG: HipA family kinase [Terracidiphilus sp.]